MPVSPAWCRPHHFLALGDVNLRTEAEHDINMVAAMESRSSSTSLVGLQPGSHACGFSSKQQSRNDHSSWMVEEWQSLLEHVGLLLCSILSLGGGEGDIWMKWHQLERFPLTYWMRLFAIWARLNKYFHPLESRSFRGLSSVWFWYPVPSVCVTFCLLMSSSSRYFYNEPMSGLMKSKNYPYKQGAKVATCQVQGKC